MSRYIVYEHEQHETLPSILKVVVITLRDIHAVDIQTRQKIARVCQYALHKNFESVVRKRIIDVIQLFERLSITRHCIKQIICQLEKSVCHSKFR